MNRHTLLQKLREHSLHYSEQEAAANVLAELSADFENILRAALGEQNGVDLTHRLTSYAISQRTKHSLDQ